MPERGPGQTIEAIKTVGYELHMMAMAAARVGRANETYEHNAAIEVELLHARALAQFFTAARRDGYRTDIRRSDFVTDNGWDKPTDALDRLATAVPTINKHLAHLTWERVEDLAEWFYGRIAVDLVDVADGWSRHLAAQRKDLYDAFRPWVFFARQEVTGATTTPPTSESRPPTCG